MRFEISNNSWFYRLLNSFQNADFIELHKRIVDMWVFRLIVKDIDKSLCTAYT